MAGAYTRRDKQNIKRDMDTVFELFPETAVPAHIRSPGI